MSKPLDVTNMKEAHNSYGDAKVHGNPGAWECG